MYFTDTRQGEIERYDLAPDGAIGPAQPFARSPANPDGSTVDASGCLWNAVWNDWSIRTYAETGELIGRLELPVQRPTSCAFGGPDLDRLYITTAIWDLTLEELEQQPLAGSVLAINLAVSGLPEPEFRG